MRSLRGREEENGIRTHLFRIRIRGIGITLGGGGSILSHPSLTFDFCVVVENSAVRLDDVTESVKGVNKANIFAIVEIPIAKANIFVTGNDTHV